VVFAGKKQELHKGFDFEERHGRIDDVQVQIVRVPENKIVGMHGREASRVSDGSLVAGRFASVHNCQRSGAWPAGPCVADVQPLMHCDHVFVLWGF